LNWFVFLGALPWVGVGIVLAFSIREPRPLPLLPTGSVPASGSARELPPVAIILPARNEAAHIQACLASLADQRYPDFSIIVVDDRSTDGTGALARAVPRGRAGAIEVIDGVPLADGWFGKPWACSQGADASGTTPLLLFTDADTRHDPALLARAVEGLTEDRADALSLLGRQELGSFGERLVQPLVFSLLGLRYRRLDRPIGPENTGDAIANGQYILVRREAYHRVGGHGAVREAVAEDLRLAQLLTGAGYRLTLRRATDALSTRMYTSLAEVVNGWTKNLAVGARQSAGWWGHLALPGILAFLIFWMVPAAVLAGAGATRAFVAGSVPGTLSVAAVVAPTGVGPTFLDALLTWSAIAWGAGVLLWARIYRRFEVPSRYALLHPVAAGIGAFIVMRSWLRGGRRIEWKGRRYGGGATREEAG